MPNPTRLSRLIDLRERAGLTQAEMTARCGVAGKQGRKTVSEWESGQATPRASRRTKFMAYLWHDLNLREDPARFDEVWTMLVEEWAWAPLRGAERAQLLDVPIPQPLTIVNVVVETATAEPVVVTAEPPPPTVDALADPPLPEIALPALSAVAQPGGFPWLAVIQTRHRWLLIAIPLLLLLIGRQVWWGREKARLLPVSATGVTPSADATSSKFASDVLMTSTVTVAASSLVLANRGFDQLPNFTGWNLLEECDYQIAAAATMAQSGDHYLTIRNRRPRCFSFYQDIFTRLEVGFTYRGAIWLRSATGHVRQGRLALWALGAAREHYETNFAVGNMVWSGDDESRLGAY